MANVNNKRAQICKMSFISIDAAEIINYPGDIFIKVKGEWSVIPISSGQFKEEYSPEAITEQELKVVVTDTGIDVSKKLRKMFSSYGLILLEFTNGDSKVVGTEDFPVVVILQESGSPAVFNLSFKRRSHEPAKYLKSF